VLLVSTPAVVGTAKDILRRSQDNRCLVTDKGQRLSGQQMVTTINELHINTGSPASADRTARRQFQATGQPVSRTQASDAMTSRLMRYEAKCVQRTCFQWGSVPLRSDIKGTELLIDNILIPLEKAIDCATIFI